jgi:hypothetical protein
MANARDTNEKHPVLLYFRKPTTARVPLRTPSPAQLRALKRQLKASSSPSLTPKKAS